MLYKKEKDGLKGEVINKIITNSRRETSFKNLISKISITGMIQIVIQVNKKDPNSSCMIINNSFIRINNKTATNPNKNRIPTPFTLVREEIRLMEEHIKREEIVQ